MAIAQAAEDELLLAQALFLLVFCWLYVHFFRTPIPFDRALLHPQLVRMCRRRA